MQIYAAEGLWTLQHWEFSGRPSLCHQRCFGELGWVLLADCGGRDSKSLLVSEEPDNDATVATAISCSSWQSNSLCIGLIRAGFNFKGEGEKLGWEKVMWVVDIRWGKPMGHQNKNYNETDTWKASRQAQIWLPVGLIPWPCRLWAWWLHSALCHRLLAYGTLGSPVICDRRADFSGVLNKEKASAEIRNIGVWASERVSRTLANVAKAKGENGSSRYRHRNQRGNRHGKQEGWQPERMMEKDEQGPSTFQREMNWKFKIWYR